MVLWFLAGNVAVRVSKELESGKRKMDEMMIRSRRSINVPRSDSLTGIPRAVIQRCHSSRGSRNLDREILWDEDNERLYVRTGASVKDRLA